MLDQSIAGLTQGRIEAKPLCFEKENEEHEVSG
jgi:hypothetical protein